MADELMFQVAVLEKTLDSPLDSKEIKPVKPMVFPVVMYGCESWTVKKSERPKN